MNACLHAHYSAQQVRTSMFIPCPSHKSGSVDTSHEALAHAGACVCSSSVFTCFSCFNFQVYWDIIGKRAMACTVVLCKAAQKDPVKKALAQQMLQELFLASVGKSAAKPEWHCKIAS